MDDDVWFVFWLYEEELIEEMYYAAAEVGS